MIHVGCVGVAGVVLSSGERLAALGEWCEASEALWDTIHNSHQLDGLIDPNLAELLSATFVQMLRHHRQLSMEEAQIEGQGIIPF